MESKFTFNILRENSEVEDFYEVKTHEKIKNSILKLINEEDEGITIGLAGDWGSGKSTIINLLKKEKDLFLFYFDAWAHEGDPLRKIFLENFIVFLIDNSSDEKIKSELELKRKTILGEVKSKTTTIKRSITILGLFLTFSTFLFTIGVGILSAINYENLTFDFTGSVNLSLYLASVLSVTPFIVLGCNAYKLKKQNLDLFNPENWTFLQNNSNETITEEVIGEEERTSTEFEKYFKEVIQIFDNKSSIKIIIVIDNLDRIDAKDSLKIWSTLQTFIQYKNPGRKDYPIFKKIFTIIPYDEDSLLKIWENYKVDENGNRIIDNHFAKSFFDKSFQLRIDVPKPIISNWLNFVDLMIGQSYKNWNASDIHIVKEILEKTRNNQSDNPKPREIKNYLNHVGFLRTFYEKEISTKSIAYYVYNRYMLGNSNEMIEKKIINNELTTSEKNIIDNENIIEIAAIVYGVNKSKGEQILLTNQIKKAFENKYKDGLLELEKNHGEVFWFITKKIFSNTDKIDEFFNFSSFLNNKFINKSNIKSDFIPLLIKYIKSEKNFNIAFTQKLNTDIKNSIDILFEYDTIDEIENLFGVYVKFFHFYEKNSESGDNQRLELFVETVSYFSNKCQDKLKSIRLEVDYQKWLLLNNTKGFKNINKLIHCSNDNILLASKSLSENIRMNNSDFKVINNIITSKVQDIKPIYDSFEKFVKLNRVRGNFLDDNFFILLNDFYFNYPEFNISSLLESYEIYSLFNNKKNSSNTFNFSLLIGLYYKSQINKFVIKPSNVNVQNSLNVIKNFWLNSNNENSELILKILRENDLVDVIYEIAKDQELKLAKDIIDLIQKETEIY